MQDIIDFFQNLLGIESWPARWQCGIWTPFHGWLYIISDIMIWLAYTAIPVAIGYFILKKRNLPYNKVFILFTLFILSCGFTHLIDALIFWFPVYRFAAIARFVTAVVSWLTVLSVFKMLPTLLNFKSTKDLEKEIHERKEAEAKLKISEERFNLALMGTDAGVFDWNLKTNEIYWSPRFFELLGYADNEIEASLATFEEIIHPDDKEITKTAGYKHLTNKTPYRFEYRLKTKSGEYHWFLSNGQATWDEDGNATRMVGTIFDIHDNKILKEKLIQNEMKFKTIIEAAPDAMVISNQEGEIQIINKQTEKLFGYTKEELIGKKVEILMPQRFAHGHHQHRENYNKEPKFREMGSERTLFGKHKNGTEVPIEISLSPIETAEGRMISAAIRDITRRKEAEKKLKLSEERFQLAVDGTSAGVWDVNLSETGKDYWSPRLYDLLGYENQEFDASVDTFKRLLHPEDVDRNFAMFNDHLHNKNPFKIEYRLKTKEGEYKWFLGTGQATWDENGTPIRMVGTIIDIHESKLIKDKLEESKERFRRLLESAPDAMVIAGKDGVIEIINKQTEKLFGYDREELIGKKIETLIPKRYAHSHVDHRDSFMANSKPREMGEGRLLFGMKKDSSEFPIEISLSPIETSEGMVVAAAIRDITKRRESEKKLKDSEELLQLAISGSQAGIWDWQDMSSSQEWWSSRFYELLGYEDQEIPATFETFKELLHPDDHDHTFKRLDAHLADKIPFVVKYRLKTKSGKYSWFLGSGQATWDDKGEAQRMVGSIIDIDKEATIEASLNMAQSVAQIGSWEYYPIENRLTLSDEAYKIFDLSKEEVALSPKAIINSVHKDDRQELVSFIKECQEKGEVSSTDYRIVTKEGNIKHVHAENELAKSPEGEVIKYFGTVQDITENKWAKEDLNVFFDNPLKLMCLCNFDGYFTRVNPLWTETFGYTAKELMSQPFMDLVHPDDLEKTQEVFNRINKENQILSVTNRYRTKSGEYRWLQWTASPSLERKIIFGVARDITVSRNAELQLKNYTLELEQKNAELEEFAYISSHDMKSPIASLDGLMSIMSESDAIKEEHKDLFEMALTSTNQLKSTINTLNEIIAFKKTLSIEKEDVNIIDLIDEVKISITQQIRETNTVFMLNLDQHKTLYYPRVHLKSILQNLITNSIKYKKEEISPVIEISSTERDGYITLVYKDNGLGMDMSQFKDKMFKLFSRYHTHTEGMGVGLHVVNSVILSYGGKIEVESELGQGTTFILKLIKL